MHEGEPYRWFKVIRISKVRAQTKKDAIKAVQEDLGSELLAVEFAKEEHPTGFWGAFKHQVMG
jgi:hypothetical protein